MNKLKKLLMLIGIAAVLAAAQAALAAPDAGWQEPGNSDLNILNGGVMLVAENGDMYFTHGGIFLQSGESVRALSPEEGRNLNLSGGMLFYTVGSEVYSMSAEGGQPQLVHTAPAEIKQLYVMGDSLRYVAGGRVYSADFSGAAEPVSDLEGVRGLIPTQYGDILLTGEPLNYTLWAGAEQVLTGVQSCYTDSGYLAVQIDNENYMAELSALFSGGFGRENLAPFDIHGAVSLMDVLDPDSENVVWEDNENNDLVLDYDALLIEAGFEPKVSLFANENTGESAIPQVSQGQRNIVKRARQLHEIVWTPLEDRAQWGNRGVFKAETTYTGIPYGQPVNVNGYVGYGVSIGTFASSVLDNTSRFYTTYSQYNKIAPVYSTDCSGYVSYAWGLTSRKTTYSIPQIAERVGDQSLYSIQIGDCLDKTTSHVVLISDLVYDGEGNIVALEVMEQTPVITKLTRYGAGERKSLASFQSYYLNGGYVIYRLPGRNDVTYTPNPAVPLDGETVSGQKDKAPRSKTKGFVGGKTVELYSVDSGAAIYYTTDGSTPTTSSNVYSGALTFYDTTKLRAIAYTGKYSAGSEVLNYTVKVPQLDPPSIKVTDGLSSGQYVSSGSKVSISSVSGATIYYTTDGSEPTTSSKTYSAPITVNEGMTIKAMAQASGYKQSNTASASYVIGTVYTINASSGADGSISPSGSVKVIQTGSAAFTAKPASGYKVENLVVDGNSLGERTEYTFANVNSNHSISVSFVPNVTLPFTDVGKGLWYYDAVCYVYGRNLYKGMTETWFGADETMTRGMFVTALGRYAGVSEKLAGTNVGVVTGSGVNIRKGPSTDTDVVGYVNNKYTAVTVLGQDSGWYKVSYGSVTGYIRQDYVKPYGNNYSDLNKNSFYGHFAQWACVTGVADGVASGSFNGEAVITREDMCVMLRNFARIYGKSLTAVNGKVTFTDDARISSGAKDAVYTLQQAGVINGMGDGSFNPKGSATRAQVAQIFKNFNDAVNR